MSQCNYCSAPLPANTNKCLYCGIRNDVDLKGRHEYSVIVATSDRICPHCDQPLETIDLNLKGRFLIEHCRNCYGLFFDPGEIEFLLNNSVANVFAVNYKQLVNINKDRFQTEQKVKYIKCPVCRNYMRRINFGHRSGVIIDRCKAHGIWLDSGEITHLMEWKKAGGQLIDSERTRANAIKNNHAPVFSGSNNSHRVRVIDIDDSDQDFLENLTSVITRLFFRN